MSNLSRIVLNERRWYGFFSLSPTHVLDAPYGFESLDEAQSSPGLHAAAGPGLAEECASLDCVFLHIIASHVISVNAKANSTMGGTIPVKDDNQMKRYIHYCRTACHPRLSDSASLMLQAEYVKMKHVLHALLELWMIKDMRWQANETGEVAAIPITVRQLEAVIRLSEALARMRLWYLLLLSWKRQNQSFQRQFIDNENSDE